MKILVVDDERVIADSLAEILKMFGYDAVSAYSGEQAIQQALLQPFNVLLTDVMMPGVNGIQAAQEIIKLHRSCKVILISGNAATAELLREAESSGLIFEILAKPIHPSVVIDHVRSIAQQRPVN